MTHGRIPLSNNREECYIRPFDMYRRAWMFADTQDGAMTNAILYSLVITPDQIYMNI